MFETEHYNVPKPATRATPVSSFSSAQYAGTIVWREAGYPDAVHSGPFLADTVYRAEVTLYAMTGWTFEGLPANSFDHEGQGVITHEAGSGTTLRVSVAFPATAAERPAAPSM